MQLYHGSSKGNLKFLKPHLADHDQPYIYLSLIKSVAAFYMVNAVKRPYYWFPYGFNDQGIPVYEELYPNALKEVSSKKRGFIYSVHAQEDDVAAFNNIPNSRISTKEMKVFACTEISDCYEYFLSEQEKGNLKINQFSKKSEAELERWYELILSYLNDKNFIQKPNCSYSLFIKEKFPSVWMKYEKENKTGILTKTQNDSEAIANDVGL